MAAFAICLVLILAMTGYSSASYCICKDGVGDSVLQKNIDYACGAGADCTQIQQNGPCYNPNTVKDHCNYAVNSYYQRKGQATGSCDFLGSATISQTAPSGQSSTCVYPSSASNPGTSTPSGNTPSINTPTNMPTTNTPTTNSPGSTFPGSTTPGFGLAPTGTGVANPEGSSTSLQHGIFLLLSPVLALLLM